VVLLSRDEIAARKRLLVFPEQPLTPRTDKAQLPPLASRIKGSHYY
jgi:hypothetical protein